MAKKQQKRKGVAPNKLTAKQEAFAAEYAKTKSAAESYRRAYNVRPETSPQQVAVQGQKLLAHPKIAQRVEELSARVAKIAAEKFDLSAEKVLGELAAIAFQNSEDIFEWGTFERPVFRKNRQTGQLEPVIGQDGQQVTETVPFARAKPSSELTRDQKRAIVSASETISRTGDRVVEIKMADKLGALKLLGAHFNLFKTTVEHTGKNGAPIALQEVKAEQIQASTPKEALKLFETWRANAVPLAAVAVPPPIKPN